jgi:GGDEF domain-containing protein
MSISKKDKTKFSDLQKENLSLKLKLERAEALINIYRHDTLTGLKMRRDFEVRFTELFESGVEFYLSFADVNGLHNLNREKNFDAGDRLIKSVASKFMNKTNGISYRIGGDEFVALSLEEPHTMIDDNFVCVWVSSKNYTSEKEMFEAADKKVVELKEAYYGSNSNDRRTR